MKTLRGIGSAMAIFGLLSAGLYFAKMNLRILMWIDSWGPTVGWGIRGGLIVLGAILFFVGKAGKK